MARKRGGLAGIWDRNKKILKPLASTAGFVFGGPAGAAAVNGAISGFDREGKGGIGFDVGEGAMGAAKGYLGGKIGQALAPGASGGGIDGLRSMFSKQGLGDMAETAGFYAKGAGKVAGNAVRGVGGWAMKDPRNMLALGQTAIGGLNAYGQAQENNMARQQNQIIAERAAQQARIREMLMPLFQNIAARRGIN